MSNVTYNHVATPSIMPQWIVVVLSGSPETKISTFQTTTGHDPVHPVLHPCDSTINQRQKKTKKGWGVTKRWNKSQCLNFKKRARRRGCLCEGEAEAREVRHPLLPADHRFQQPCDGKGWQEPRADPYPQPLSLGWTAIWKKNRNSNDSGIGEIRNQGG